MASLLDIGLLQSFDVLFPFLLVFVVILGVLSYIKLFGDNKALQAMFAVIVALMVLLSEIARETINRMAPWFILFAVFIVFVLIAFKMFGASDKDIMGVLKSSEYGYISFWIFAVVLIIALGSLTSVISERGGFGAPENATIEDRGAEQAVDFWSTLVHPKVLGMAALLLISLFTISRLTSS